MDADTHKNDTSLKEKILKLKQERHAIILAHNYQQPEIQDIADVVEDSLGLAKAAAATTAEVIVFCGVHFMAETAFMLNPTKTVLLPDLHAGCPMADMVTPQSLSEFKQKHPHATVVCYINSSAEVKAESDICCTSSNAASIVNKISAQEIIFIPDQSLGAFVETKTDKKVHLYPGYCPTHHRLREKDVLEMRQQHPECLILAHPECTHPVLSHCDFVGSTSAILQYARTFSHNDFLIGTEAGILHRLKKENPHKTFHLLSEKLVCPNMKLTTLEKIVGALENMEHCITVPGETAKKAIRCIEKMLELS